MSWSISMMMVNESLSVADYYTAAVGKFKVEAAFDVGTVDVSTLNHSLGIIVTGP